MSRLHGPREAGSPSRTRKSVTFDYQDEVIQYDVQTPEPRYTPDPDYSQFDVHSHPLPSLPTEFGDFGVDNTINMGHFTEEIEEEFEAESSESPPNVTLGWDDEIPPPASPNPLMAELDQSRPKLSKRVEAVMEEAPELSKKPFVRTHRANASWGSQTLREGLHAVPLSPLVDTSAEEESDDESHHLERLPSLIRQESLLESQRRPHTVRMSEKRIPPPTDVQRTYSQRRKTLVKMLDANKPQVPDAIEEEEDEVNPVPLSTSTRDLFHHESVVVGVDPGSPQRESPQELLASMSPIRDSIQIPDLSHTDADYFGMPQDSPKIAENEAQDSHKDVPRKHVLDNIHQEVYGTAEKAVLEKTLPQIVEKESQETDGVIPQGSRVVSQGKPHQKLSLETIQEMQEINQDVQIENLADENSTETKEEVNLAHAKDAMTKTVQEAHVSAESVPKSAEEVENPSAATKTKKPRNRKRSKAKGRKGDTVEDKEIAKSTEAVEPNLEEISNETTALPVAEPNKVLSTNKAAVNELVSSSHPVPESDVPQIDSMSKTIVEHHNDPTILRRPLPVIDAIIADEPTVEHPESPAIPMQEMTSPEVKLESYNGTPIIPETTEAFRANSVARRLAAIEEVETPEIAGDEALSTLVQDVEPATVQHKPIDAETTEPQALESEIVQPGILVAEPVFGNTPVYPEEEELNMPQLEAAKESVLENGEPVDKGSTSFKESDLPVVEKATEAPNEAARLQFAPVDLGDTPDLGAISSSPFELTMPGTPTFNTVSPSQAEIERREYLVRQAEIVRLANERAQPQVVAVDESVDEVEQGSPSSVVEKQQTDSPVISLPHLDSDLSESEMSSPEISQLRPAADIPEPVTVISPVMANSEFSRAPPISTSTLSVETGDSLQNMSSELEQLLTPRRGYTVRESPTYVMASSPARQRSTPVRRNGALEIGAGPHIPQAASCGQISHASPRRMPQSASASPVRVPEHSRRSRPVWMATAPPLQEEPEVTVPEPVAIKSPALPAEALAAFSSNSSMGPIDGDTPPLRELTPPLANASSDPQLKERPTSEIHVPRVRPSRELLNEQYKQLPAQESGLETPRRGSGLLFSSPVVRKTKSPTKFAGRLTTSLHETGRLFVRVDSVVTWLPDIVSRTCQVWLELDNGEHCITTPCADVVGDAARFGKEYELVVGPEESVTVTTHIKWQQSGPTGTTLLSKLRRKQPEVDWQRLVAADGAFGRCTLNFADMSTAALGAPTPVSLELANEWTGGKGGKIGLTTLFVPRMSAKESLPATMDDAVTQIEAAQRAAKARKTGLLIVNGKQRWCLVDDASLVIYSEARRPRASFNLNKATACDSNDSFVTLAFRTGDVLTLEADSTTSAHEWSTELAKTIASPSPRSPWLNLVLYR